MTISDTLKSVIRKSRVPYLVLEKATGVQRASISRFLRGTQSLRLDHADALARYYGLVLKPEDKAKRTRKGGK